MKLAKITAALGFAHLLGLPAAAAASVDDDKDDKKDKKDAKAGEGGDPDEEDKDDKKDAKAAGGDQDEDDKDDTKAEDDEDDATAEDGESDKEKAARQSERARCAAIFASPAAGGRPDMAAHLAFNTGMGAKAAVEMLGVIAAGGASQPRGLATRMSGVTIPNVGASAPAGKQGTGATSAASMIIEAGKKRRGEA
jgi:hypothetical protein